MGAAGRRDPDALLADADAAAYRAKAEGRGRVEVFDTRLRRHARERLRTAAALERALSLGQLRLAFQPIVRLADGVTVGHEALLRWDSPGGVMSAPADFIPVAEESALIVEIGAWTLMQACHESAAGYGVDEDGPTVGVNLSRRQLAQPDLPALVADCLRSSGLPARRLRLEVKEAVLLGAPKAATDNLEKLRAAGVGLALDDFGTGYSSLRNLQVAAVKIDQLLHRPARAEPRRHGDRRRDRLARPGAGDRRDRRGRRERGAGRAAARARLPAGAGLPVRCPRRPDNLRSVTTFEELDALSSRELHDRAVKRAEHRLDIPFFWRLLQEGTAADAAEGSVERGDEQVSHWSRQVLEVLRHDDDALNARRPIYIDYLLKHEG